MNPADIASKVLQGSKQAAARAISLVENESVGYAGLLKALYAASENAYVIGITGPPGAGKSTLTDKLAKTLADAGNIVGVVAVDPSSPFTKGAILGDRVRMASLALHPNIFIRSMGSRGFLGGLSKACAGAAVVLGAYGARYILVETVGVGQSEIEIAKMADTVLMVLAPGLGDEIQTLKAGIMEIGNVFAVNKSDREGAQKTYRETLSSLDYKQDWGFKPPVCLTNAESGEGVSDLLAHICAHESYLHESGEFTTWRRSRKAELVKEIVRDTLIRRIDSVLAGAELGDEDPFTLAETHIRSVNHDNPQS